ncbi:hypothetical protein [Vibrio harveyi]|uniref:hypothetical protein n=1 Tax=Vibrio harveyi TaxID=669 RepID=UPI003CEB9D53
MPQQVMPALEHHFANQVLREQEERTGQIEVYSVVINPSAINRSSYASDEAKKVTIDGVDGFLVVDQYEDYLRPDFISEQALVEKPVFVKAITPNADKVKAAEASKKNAEKEAENAQKQRAEKDSASEINRLNQVQLVNEKIADFNESTGAHLSPIPHTASAQQAQIHNSLIDKANAIIDEHGPVASKQFKGLFMNAGILAEQVNRVESLMSKGFEYITSVEDEVFSLKIKDIKGKTILDYQAEILEEDADLEYMVHGEFDSSYEQISVPVLKINTEEPLVHIEFGSDLRSDPEKSFFLNEVDTLGALDEVYFYDEDNLYLEDFSSSNLVLNSGNLNLHEHDKIFNNSETEKISSKIKTYMHNRNVRADFAPSF